MSSILTLAGNNTSTGFYPHTIYQSLRFEDGDSARLTRTPSSAGNRRTWTWSAWIKRGNISLSNKQRLFATLTGGGLEENFRFETNDKLRWYCHNATGESADNDLTTSAVFRDVSAWYHIVVVKDTTESTASNRNRLYVNGVLQSWAGTNYSSSNYEGFINQTNQHAIAAHAGNVLDEFDGYMSEVVFLDGVAGDPTALGLGELKDGIWVPKDVSGLTYGTNGFHLDFADSSAIGNDVSGQNNDFTVTGLVASDVMTGESPTNNFAVMNVLDQELDATTKEGNLFVTTSSAGRGKIRSTFTIPETGKWYWEAYLNSSSVLGEIGVAPQSLALKNTDQLRVGADNYTYRFNDGQKGNNSTLSSYGNSLASGDVASVLFDADAGAIYFYKNGTIQNSGTAAFTSIDTSLDYCPAMGDLSTSDTVKIQWNFGQDSTFAGRISAGGNSDSAGIGDFKYAVPSGAKALCSANLPEPAIIDGSEYFNTVLYSGNSSTQAITGVGFQPDWCWLKATNFTYSHGLFDSVRGATKKIYSNSNSDEATESGLTSFDADGFTLGSAAGTNNSGKTYVAWNWKAGTAVSGATTGSGTAKTYTGSVNTEAGFSIIKYVGNGTSGHTIPHNLTTTPTMIMVKRLDADGGWRVQHKDVAATHYLALDTNADPADLNTIFNDTAFDSTVFTVGNASSINGNDKDYIAYCFTDIDQYCRAGVYSGNTDADGPYVNLGFRPAWVMVKTISADGNWWISDSVRGTYNPNGPDLRADVTDSENTNNIFDFLSNGFKLRFSGGQVNTTDRDLIYLAFSEQPFKYSNAR